MSVIITIALLLLVLFICRIHCSEACNPEKHCGNCRHSEFPGELMPERCCECRRYSPLFPFWESDETTKEGTSNE